MIKHSKFKDAVKRTFNEHPHFRGTILSMLAGKSRSGMDPQAYLVHQQPDWEFIPHFHLEEQFQVFVGGDGAIGRHELAPITVHYASREAGYGPLIAGKEGLSYFTLRAMSDDGLWPLPEKREIMQSGLQKKQLTIENVQSGAADAGTLRPILEASSEGLAGWWLKMDQASPWPEVDHGEGGGTFYLVLDGVVNYQGDEFEKHSCFFVSPDESGFELTATSAEVLILRFPQSAVAARNYPQERYQVA